MEDTEKLNLCLNCGKPIKHDPRFRNIIKKSFHDGCRKEYATKKIKQCTCGCGELIPNINKRGEIARFKTGHQNRGKNNSRWSGGRNPVGDGYIDIWKPDHPYASKDGYVREHRLVMEEHLGRYLKPEELVHHKNENRSDNRIENLQLMSKKEHQHHHISKDMSHRICSICGGKTYVDKRGYQWWHKSDKPDKWICSRCYRNLHR